MSVQGFNETTDHHLAVVDSVCRHGRVSCGGRKVNAA